MQVPALPTGAVGWSDPNLAFVYISVTSCASLMHCWLSPVEERRELISLCIELVRSLLPQHISSRHQAISFHWDDGALLDTGIQYTMGWALKAAKTSNTPNPVWKARWFWHSYMGIFCCTKLILRNRRGTWKIFAIVSKHLHWGDSQAHTRITVSHGWYQTNDVTTWECLCKAIISRVI